MPIDNLRGAPSGTVPRLREARARAQELVRNRNQ